MDPNLLKKLNIERAARRACAVVTDLSDGRDRLVKQAGSDVIQGPLGNAIQAALRSGKSSIFDTEGRRFFINAHVPALRIVVIGAVHISQALAQIAKAVDYTIDIVDPRTAFATPERFPGVDVYAQWPEDYLAAHPLDTYTALVAVSHDPKIDDAPLIEALYANCLYVGALGSRKTHSKRVERLAEAGILQEKISRISSPIGLDIAAASPAEIAVAIMAEIIQVLRLRDGA
ncbi:XdhC family protein [Ahrensia kielensis]|uniref:XdhC family protein n=1 Tax=Ahrensia kielensis TaxID=76980 RepID=UPI0003620F84|nr:XdhC family protein [Ahrensia kielensis]